MPKIQKVVSDVHQDTITHHRHLYCRSLLGSVMVLIRLVQVCIVHLLKCAIKMLTISMNRSQHRHLIILASMACDM